MILALTLLLAVAQPTFAVCINCMSYGDCGYGENSNRCRPTIDGCYSGAACAGSVSVSSLASEYRIASVEITHGTDAKVQVAEKKSAKPAAARVAEARK